MKAANPYNFLLKCGAVIPVVWLMVRLVGGRGVWLATPIILLLMLVSSILYILKWKIGDSFSEKRLLLGPESARAAGEELSISADTLVEVMGMSRIAGLFCRKNGIDPKKANILALCVEELGVNIIEHGFSDGAQHTIDMRMLVKKGELILRIRDDCKLFNLTEQYHLFSDQEDITRHIGIRMVVGTCRDIQYLSTLSTNNLIIRV